MLGLRIIPPDADLGRAPGARNPNMLRKLRGADV
jgi:hypothetical protein